MALTVFNQLFQAVSPRILPEVSKSPSVELYSKIYRPPQRLTQMLDQIPEEQKRKLTASLEQTSSSECDKVIERTGSEIKVNTIPVSDNVLYLKLLKLYDNNMLVYWLEASKGIIFARKFDFEGEPMTDQLIMVVDATSYKDMKTVGFRNGRVSMIYIGEDLNSLYYQLFDPDLQPIGEKILINAKTLQFEVISDNSDTAQIMWKNSDVEEKQMGLIIHQDGTVSQPFFLEDKFFGDSMDDRASIFMGSTKDKIVSLFSNKAIGIKGAILQYDGTLIKSFQISSDQGRLTEQAIIELDQNEGFLTTFELGTQDVSNIYTQKVSKYGDLEGPLNSVTKDGERNTEARLLKLTNYKVCSWFAKSKMYTHLFYNKDMTIQCPNTNTINQWGPSIESLSDSFFMAWLDYIKKDIKLQRFGVVDAPTPQENNPESHTVMYAVIAAAGAVLSLLGGWFGYVQCKKRQKKDDNKFHPLTETLTSHNIQ